MRRGSRLGLLIIVVLALAGCISTLPGGPGSPVPHPPGGGDGGGKDGPGYLVRRVSDKNDDVWIETRHGKQELKNNGGVLWFGGSGFGRTRHYESSAYFRWQNVTIPQGAKITEAYVVVRPKVASGGGINEFPTRVYIRGLKVENVGPYGETNRPDKIVATNGTVATVLWEINEPWTSEDPPWPRTVDISAVIQEIVNQARWKEGNALGLAFESGHEPMDPKADEYNRQVYEYSDQDPDSAATLYVSYEIATR